MREIQVSGHDLFNYLAGKHSGQNHISVILRFSGRIDQELLEKAVRKLEVLEPVLACRVVEKKESLIWQHRENVHCERVRKEETDQPEELLRNFVAASFLGERGGVKLLLISEGERDWLGIVMDHTAGDAGGMKQYIFLLFKVYNEFIQGRSGDFPVRDGKRDCRPVLEKIMAWRKELGMDHPKREVRPSVWGIPFRAAEGKAPSFLLRRYHLEQLRAWKDFGKEKNATVNDILLAAFYRSLFAITHCKEGDVYVSVDLRQHMGEERELIPVGNYSSPWRIWLENIIGEDFTCTVNRVADITRNMKKNYEEGPIGMMMEEFSEAGLVRCDAWFGEMHIQGRKTGCVTPVFSNIGILAETINCGDVKVDDAYMVGPAMATPGLLLAVSTYGETVTMAVHYFASDVVSAQVEKLFIGMDKELKEIGGTGYGEK